MRDNVHEPMIDKLTHEIKCYFDTLSKTYYHQGLEDGIEEGAKSVKSWDKACYEQGLNDAWEAARIIYGMNKDTRLVTTAFVHYETVFDNYSASEAIAKIKEYEEKQTDDEFRVGDEVECPQIDGKGIVINKANKDTLLILSANMDGLLRTEENKVHKTGKHIDAIEEVLKQMREDNE